MPENVHCSYVGVLSEKAREDVLRSLVGDRDPAQQEPPQVSEGMRVSRAQVAAWAASVPLKPGPEVVHLTTGQLYNMFHAYTKRGLSAGVVIADPWAFAIELRLLGLSHKVRKGGKRYHCFSREAVKALELDWTYLHEYERFPVFFNLRDVPPEYRGVARAPGTEDREYILRRRRALKQQAYDKKRRRSSPREKVIESALKTSRKKIGWAPGEHERAWAAKPGPGYRCAICQTTKPHGKAGRWVADHNHKTGMFRAYLCHPCNIRLGFAEKYDLQLSAQEAVYVSLY